jgi:DnaJ-domain-containing protein 1
MEHAWCAARCEECHHLVCGECFADYSVPGEGEEEAEERRLCATCAEELGTERLETEEDGELEPEEEDEVDEVEGGDDVDEDDRGEDDEDEDPDEEDSDETQEDDAGEEPAAEDDPADARQRTGDAGADGHRSTASGREPSAWEILGVAPGAPLAEVRKAYLTLIAQYHPDKVAQLGPKLQALALEETRRLNQAFDALRGRGSRA